MVGSPARQSHAFSSEEEIASFAESITLKHLINIIPKVNYRDMTAHEDTRRDGTGHAEMERDMPRWNGTCRDGTGHAETEQDMPRQNGTCRYGTGHAETELDESPYKLLRRCEDVCIRV